MKRTFIDAGVLIAAARGSDEAALRAMEILDDPDREFVSSPFLRLEVEPKALYYGKKDEADFYAACFRAVTWWADDLARIAADAHREACASGLAAMDALHVAAAACAGADELVTTEAPEKPIHRARTVRVISIHPLATGP